MPHSNVLSGLMKNIALAVTMISKHPLETLPDTPEDPSPQSLYNKEEPKKTKFLQVIVDETRRLKSPHSEASSVLQKISSTPVHKLKNVMFKKMLLKLVYIFYDERIKDRNNSSYFYDFVFMVLVKKYMMKKAAESKFHHLLASCAKYKSIPRVRLFGRFMGLYHGLDNDDLNFYIECIEFLQNSPSGTLSVLQDLPEIVTVPYVRCIECLKYHEKSLPKTGTMILRMKLDKMRRNDNINRLGVVDMDEFLEQVIEIYSEFNKSTKNFMKCIYEAADLNNDGYLQFKEFELLIRFLSVYGYNKTTAFELFEEYSETFLSEEDDEVKAISFENLCVLNKLNKLFSSESIKKFTGLHTSEDVLKALESIQNSLEDVLSELLWRFTETQLWEDHMEELNCLLESAKNKLLGKSDPETAYLAYKLIDMESKRALIEDRVYELLPKFCMSLY